VGKNRINGEDKVHWNLFNIFGIKFIEFEKKFKN
jgi:hypothetical protein